jgi:hypothetical protein
VEDVDTLVEDCCVVTEVLEADEVELEVAIEEEDEGVEDDALCELDVCTPLEELVERVELVVVVEVLCDVA